MTRRRERAAVVVSPTAAGRFAGALLLFGAATTLLTVLEQGPASPGRSVNTLVALLAAMVGVVALVTPWARWPPAATLTLVPVVFVLLAAGNLSHPDPYVAGIFFIVLAMWTGLCHRRFTTLALSPIIAFVYWYPLSRGAHLPTLESSTVTITVVAVLVGEVLGALTERLGAARDRLIDAQSRRFEALVQHSADVTLIFDRAGVITYVSPTVRQIFGYTEADIEGFTTADLAGQWIDGLDRHALDDVADRDEGDPFDDVSELRVLHADGHWVDAEAVVQDRLDDVDIQGVVVHIRDIHLRKELERDLHRQAYHDELTGLANRSLFRDRVNDAVQHGAPFAVIFLDLDGFKVINDSAGHDRGDEVLRLVAQRFRSAIEADVTLARFGGDEFAVLVPVTARAPGAICRTLVETLRDPFAIGGSGVSIGASAGIAEYTGTESADDLIRNADTAMYVAKSDGRDMVWYEPSMREHILERLDTESMLRQGLETGAFAVHYQAEVDLCTGLTSGVEALVRWNHPTLGLVMPAAFIDVAEDSGLILALGAWVMHTACRDAASWQATIGTGRGVAVNVSVRQFQAPDFVDTVRSALLASTLDPTLLTVEITESVLIADNDTAAATLRELSELGVSIALDDFGTGYSSLRYLQRLPFDILKIDKSFIDNVTTEPHDLALVRTINRLGHDLGLRTLVEGIETEEQAALVTELGCDFAQGYFFGRPVPLEQLRIDWSRQHDAVV